MPDLELKSRESAAERCPYCHDCLEGGQIADAQVVCEGCGTSHHRACLAELGGCTVMGCSGGAPAPEGGLEEIRERIRSRVGRLVPRIASPPDPGAAERMAKHWSCSACHLDFAVSDCPSCGAELLRRCQIFGRHCTSCERRFFHGRIIGLQPDPDQGTQILQRLVLFGLLGTFLAVLALIGLLLLL